MSLNDLRRLEADFQKKVGNRLSPESPVVIGPKGVTFGINVGLQIPFRELLKGKLPNGQPSMPDEALRLVVDEALAEMKERGIKY